MKEEKMPEEAKVLLEMIQKAGDKGVTRQEMKDTPMGDLFMNLDGFKWLIDHRKIQCHVKVKGSNLINTWFLPREREGEEEIPDYFKKAIEIS